MPTKKKQAASSIMNPDPTTDIQRANAGTKLHLLSRAGSGKYESTPGNPVDHLHDALQVWHDRGISGEAIIVDDIGRQVGQINADGELVDVVYDPPPTRSDIVLEMRRHRGQPVPDDVSPLPPYSTRSANWAFWRVHEVMIWEGVALSLDIDPSRVRDRGYKADGSHMFHESKLFNARLHACGRSSQEALPRIAVSSCNEDAKVSLEKFAEWALMAGWMVPKELAVLAEDMATPSMTKVTDGILRRMQEKYDELRASGDLTPAGRMQRKLERETGISRGAIRRRWHLMKL